MSSVPRYKVDNLQTTICKSTILKPVSFCLSLLNVYISLSCISIYCIVPSLLLEPYLV